MSSNGNEIDEFLTRTKQCLWRIAEFDCVTVVMGNETCDLDSVVSSLIYGYSYFHQFKRAHTNELAMTVLNIPKDVFKTKTESLYWLQKHEVTTSLLLFRDEIDLQQLSESVKIKVILVDHHTLSKRLLYLEPLVVQVIDHRPRDLKWTWENVDFILEPVGSCATLITRELLKRKKEVFSPQITGLLYGPIVLDTAGLNHDFGRATTLDVEMIELMEELYPIFEREEILQNLIKARSDVSNLTPDLILKKDMKYASGIPICGMPMLIEEFIKKDGVQRTLETFCEHENVPYFALMGLLMRPDDSVVRDIGVFSKAHPESAERLAEFLLCCNKPNLGLKAKSNSGISGLLLFEQENYKLTRKQILPLVEYAVDTIPELCHANRLSCNCCDNPETASCSSTAN